MLTERVIQMEARLESERIKVEDLRRICENTDDEKDFKRDNMQVSFEKHTCALL